MKIRYEHHNLKPETLLIIAIAERIVEQYQAMGMSLTLRQLYYRFIATDAFPDSWIDPVYNARNGLPPDTKNTIKNYKRLGGIVGKARMAGLISWQAIEDRTRSLRKASHWTSPADIVDVCAAQFAVDRWEGQEKYVEVWIEKDALVGVFEDPELKHLDLPPAERDVPLFSCRGYGSLSEIWAAGRRLRTQARAGRVPVVLHFGDHDPSGIDMTRDIRERLSTFAERSVTVERIALNMDQVEEHDPPPNPAKTTDSRFEGYVLEYGSDSWELDALEPTTLRELVNEAVDRHLDRDLYDERVAEEEEGRKLLRSVAENWEEIEETYG